MMAAEELRQMNLSNGDATAADPKLTDTQSMQASGLEHQSSSRTLQGPDFSTDAANQSEQDSALIQKIEALRT